MRNRNNSISPIKAKQQAAKLEHKKAVRNAKVKRYQAKTMSKYGNPGEYNPTADAQKTARQREVQKTARHVAYANAVSSALKQSNRNASATDSWNSIILQGDTGSNQNGSTSDTPANGSDLRR